MHAAPVSLPMASPTVSLGYLSPLKILGANVQIATRSKLFSVRKSPTLASLSRCG